MLKRAYIYMHTAIFLWGFTGIFGRLITLDYGHLVWYRMLISAASLAGFLWYIKKMIFPPPMHTWRMVATGIVVALHWLLFYAAIKVSNISITLSCFATVSLFTALLEPLFFRKKIVTAEIVLSIITLIGIVLIAAAHQVYVLGITLALISSALGALFTIINKKFVTHHPPLMVTFIELTGGFLFLTALLPFYLHFTKSTFAIPGMYDTFYLVLLSILCTTVAFSLSLYALRSLNAFILNLSVNLEPIYSIILAIIIFHENHELNPSFYIGTLLILGSVFAHVWWQSRKQPQGEKIIID